MTNILILSAGTRNLIVQYFKQAMAAKDGMRLGCVIAADMSPLAPAIYDADSFELVPAMSSEGYLECVFEICKKRRITGVLSLIDPELSVLAAHEPEFRALGVTVISSSYELCELSLDKMQMYDWLVRHGYRTSRSYASFETFSRDLQAGLVRFPVFVKPIRGSASIAINKASDVDTVSLLMKHRSDLMVQEFLDGQEIGADVYVDLISGEIVSIFTKKKLKMRAGETDKSVSFRDPKLFSLIERFVREAGFRGPIDIDLFDVNGEYYISEVNPRFGGGYPHAQACGCDHPGMIVRNLRGETNTPRIGSYEDGVAMMKYSEIRVLRDAIE